MAAARPSVKPARKAPKKAATKKVVKSASGSSRSSGSKKVPSRTGSAAPAAAAAAPKARKTISKKKPKSTKSSKSKKTAEKPAAKQTAAKKGRSRSKKAQRSWPHPREQHVVLLGLLQNALQPVLPQCTFYLVAARAAECSSGRGRLKNRSSCPLAGGECSSSSCCCSGFSPLTGVPSNSDGEALQQSAAFSSIFNLGFPRSHRR
ncbi:hypothetical protein Emag_006864 [Eimeria magna]